MLIRLEQMKDHEFIKFKCFKKEGTLWKHKFSNPRNKRLKESDKKNLSSDQDKINAITSKQWSYQIKLLKQIYKRSQR